MAIALRAFLAALALVLSSATLAAAPVVKLSPGVGPPTANLTATGTGFSANTAIDVFFDLTDLCLTFSDGTGKAVCTIKVPASAQPQQHWVSMLQRSTYSGAQKPFLVRTDMPQFHGRNAQHQGVNPFENTINASNAAQLEVVWTAPIGAGGTEGSPVVWGGNVYVGGINGKLYAFNATTGAAVAPFPITTGSPGIYFSTPAVSGGIIYVGGSDGQLWAYNIATGAVHAGFPKLLGGNINSPPAVALGNVYIGCDDGMLYAFNAATGVAVSGFPVPVHGVVYDAPTVFNGIVYLGSRDFKLYAFNALNGTTIAGFPVSTGGWVDATLAAARGMGFFGSNDSKFYGVALADGSSLSAYPSNADSPIGGSAAVSTGRAGTAEVFEISGAGILYPFNMFGTQEPYIKLGEPAYSSPMIANGVLYVATQKSVWAIGVESRSGLWKAAATASSGLNSPVIANGILYYAANDGFLYAYSVNGQAPSARLPGGALGVRPALTALHPDPTLKPGQPALAPAPEEE